MKVIVTIFFRNSAGDLIPVEDEMVWDMKYRKTLRGSPRLTLESVKTFNKLMEEVEDGFSVEIRKQTVSDLQRVRGAGYIRAQRLESKNIRLSKTRSERAEAMSRYRKAVQENEEGLERSAPRIRISIHSDHSGKGD